MCVFRRGRVSGLGVDSVAEWLGDPLEEWLFVQAPLDYKQRYLGCWPQGKRGRQHPICVDKRGAGENLP